MIGRSVRSRATLVAAATVAVVFGVGSWVTVRSLERSLRSDLTNQNEQVLDDLADQIEAGNDPRTIQIPFGSDGTEYLILDPDEQLVNSSFFSLGPVATPPIVFEVDNGAVGFVEGFSVSISEGELADLTALNQADLTETEQAALLQDIIGGTVVADGANPAVVLPGDVVVGDGVVGPILIEQNDWLETRRSVTDPDGRRLTLVGLSPIRIAERNIDRLAWVMAGLVPVLTLLGAAAAWWTTGVALSPVGKITDEANRIAPSNSGDRLPVPASGDEIALLASTLNRMLDRLDDGLTRQRQFVSDASHELRTPLTSVRGAAAILSSRTDLDPTTARNAELIARGAERLGAVLDDLTAVATGAATIERDVVDLADVVLAAVDEVRDSRPGLEIDTDRIESHVCSAGAVQIGRAVGNLLSNAIRHADQRVEVAVRAVDDEIEIVVDDDGPGVPPGRRQEVFERFVRLDDARGRDDGGTGLGLALVASIAEAHRGSVACTDSPIGGARFVLRLPAVGSVDGR